MKRLANLALDFLCCLAVVAVFAIVANWDRL